MKSTMEQLETRGYLSSDKFEELIKHNLDDENNINNSNPFLRTAYYRYLKTQTLNEKQIDQLINALKKEKKLYTKIELCELLSLQSDYAVEKLIEQLGKISNNQINELTKFKTSIKLSYPLARDLVARILAKMDYKNFPIILTYAPKDLIAIREYIDTLGYMCFYNHQLITLSNYKAIINALKPYFDDEIVLIKFCTLCSAFPYNLTKGVIDSMPILRQEPYLKELTRTKKIQTLHFNKTNND